MIHRFVGTKSTIGDRGLTRFGESIDMDAAAGRTLMLGNGPETGFSGSCPLLPDGEFSKIGFTEQELRDYQWPGSHEDASPEFKRKKAQALAALHTLRTENEPPSVEIHQPEPEGAE